MTKLRLFALLAFASCAGELPAPRRPDVIVYLVDALRADRVGAYGNPRGLTPEIDRFAKLPGALLFERGVAQAPWTRPSVASLFTGLRPTAHGVSTLERSLDASAETLAERLGALGYRTAAFSTNWHVIPDTGLAQGFQEFVFDPKLTSSPDLAARVETWLQTVGPVGQSPFFLYVHALDPHAPYEPPAGLRARFAPDVARPAAGTRDDLTEIYALRPRDRRDRVRDLALLYDAEVAAADAGFGRFLTALERAGRLDGALIAFLADHGESFDEHLRLGHAVDLHGESLSIPWILKLDGESRRPRRIPAVAQHIDLVPTVLARLGVAAAGLPGYDLLAADGGDRFAVSHLDYDRRRGLALTTWSHRYIEPLSRRFGDERLLYDLLADPLERANVLAANPALAARLRALALDATRTDYERRLDAPAAQLDEEARRGLEALGYVAN
jgi:arylsulfatase A-like enzyme